MEKSPLMVKFGHLSNHRFDVQDLVDRYRNLIIISQPLLTAYDYWIHILRWEDKWLTIGLMITLNIISIYITKIGLFFILIIVCSILSSIGILHRRCNLFAKVFPNIEPDAHYNSTTHSQNMQDFRLVLAINESIVKTCLNLILKFYSFLKWEDFNLSLRFHLIMFIHWMLLIIFPIHIFATILLHFILLYNPFVLYHRKLIDWMRVTIRLTPIDTKEACLYASNNIDRSTYNIYKGSQMEINKDINIDTNKDAYEGLQMETNKESVGKDINIDTNKDTNTEKNERTHLKNVSSNSQLSDCGFASESDSSEKRGFESCSEDESIKNESSNDPKISRNLNAKNKNVCHFTTMPSFNSLTNLVTDIVNHPSNNNNKMMRCYDHLMFNNKGLLEESHSNITKTTANVGERIDAKTTAYTGEQIDAKTTTNVGERIDAKTTPYTGERIDAKTTTNVGERIDAKTTAYSGERIDAKTTANVGERIDAKTMAYTGEQVDDNKIINIPLNHMNPIYNVSTEFNQDSNIFWSVNRITNRMTNKSFSSNPQLEVGIHDYCDNFETASISSANSFEAKSQADNYNLTENSSINYDARSFSGLFKSDADSSIAGVVFTKPNPGQKIPTLVEKLMELKRRSNKPAILPPEKCNSCNVLFTTLFKRRHICNYCGNHFCSRCCCDKVPRSIFGATAPAAQTETVPVCKGCLQILMVPATEKI